jgi:hypothetical protein
MWIAGPRPGSSVGEAALRLGLWGVLNAGRVGV